MATSSIYRLFRGIIIFSGLPYSVFGELVSCRLGQTCVLPCRYGGQLDMIHWTRQPEDYNVHVFVNDRDELRNQHPLYSTRTSLSEDRSRGDASLLLSQVTLKDQGRFRCFTSSSQGGQSHSLELTVFAPVLQVSLEQEGQQLLCRSEGIYPRPSVVWSVSTEAITSVSESEQGLFSVNSSVSLSDSENKYMCNISTAHSWRRAVLNVKNLEHELSSDQGPNVVFTVTLGFFIVFLFSSCLVILRQRMVQVHSCQVHSFQEQLKDIYGKYKKTPPNGQDTSSERQDTSSERQDTSSERQDTSSEGHDTSSEGQDTPPEGQDTPPEGQDTPPEGQDTPPEGQDTPPEGQDRVDSSVHPDDDDAHEGPAVVRYSAASGQVYVKVPPHDPLEEWTKRKKKSSCPTTETENEGI